jgi:hypothetical protein
MMARDTAFGQDLYAWSKSAEDMHIVLPSVSRSRALMGSGRADTQKGATNVTFCRPTG